MWQYHVKISYSPAVKRITVKSKFESTEVVAAKCGGRWKEWKTVLLGL